MNKIKLKLYQIQYTNDLKKLEILFMCYSFKENIN